MLAGGVRDPPDRRRRAAPPVCRPSRAAARGGEGYAAEIFGALQCELSILENALQGPRSVASVESLLQASASWLTNSALEHGNASWQRLERFRKPQIDQRRRACNTRDTDEQIYMFSIVF